MKRPRWTVIGKENRQVFRDRQTDWGRQRTNWGCETDRRRGEREKSRQTDRQTEWKGQTGWHGERAERDSQTMGRQTRE